MKVHLLICSGYDTFSGRYNNRTNEYFGGVDFLYLNAISIVFVGSVCAVATCVELRFVSLCLHFLIETLLIMFPFYHSTSTIWLQQPDFYVVFPLVLLLYVNDDIFFLDW